MSQVNIGGTTLSFKDSSFTGDQWESVASWVLNGGAEECEKYAKEAKSYAKGGTATREGEDTDNAKYYKEQSEAAATKAETASNHPPRIGSNGNWEIWDFSSEKYVQTDYPSKGSASTVLGLYPTIDALEAVHPTGSAGSAWLIGTEADNVVYQWDVDKAAWVNVGKLAGAQGAQGPEGKTGPQGPNGADGKNAYQYAQDGGYSMTEADFYSDLADVGTKQSKITAKGILKGNGSGGVSAAAAGTDYAAPSIALAVTLTAAGWDADTKTQTVAVTGMTASANCIITAAPASYMAYAEAGVRCTAQISGGLSFTCEEIPTEDLTVNVLILG